MSTVTEGQWLSSRGATIGGGRGDIMVGWWDQGGGANGHTAGTFGDGTNFESNGSDGVVVGGHTGANDPSFTDHAYFPEGFFGGASTASPNAPALPRTTGDVPGTTPGTYGASPGYSTPSGAGTPEVDPRVERQKKLSDTISGRFGDAASEFVSGQIKDLFGVFSIPDNPPALKAYNELQSAQDDYRSYQDSVTKYDQKQAEAGAASPEPLTPLGLRKPPPAPAGRDETGDTGVLYDPSKGAAQWTPVIERALQMVGSSLANVDRSIEQTDIESHGDPNAVGPESSDGNPSGLVQVKPGTFAAYRSSDLPDSVTDPLANLYAGMNYAINRYDALEKIWPTRAGYDSGGVLRPGMTLVENKTGRNEVAAVFNPQQWDTMTQLASGGSAGGGLSIGQITGSNAQEIAREVMTMWKRSQARHTGRSFQNA
jgi:hypothetical protein